MEEARCATQGCPCGQEPCKFAWKPVQIKKDDSVELIESSNEGYDGEIDGYAPKKAKRIFRVSPQKPGLPKRLQKQKAKEEEKKGHEILPTLTEVKRSDLKRLEFKKLFQSIHPIERAGTSTKRDLKKQFDQELCLRIMAAPHPLHPTCVKVVVKEYGWRYFFEKLGAIESAIKRASSAISQFKKNGKQLLFREQKFIEICEGRNVFEPGSAPTREEIENAPDLDEVIKIDRINALERQLRHVTENMAAFKRIVDEQNKSIIALTKVVQEKDNEIKEIKKENMQKYEYIESQFEERDGKMEMLGYHVAQGSTSMAILGTINPKINDIVLNFRKMTLGINADGSHSNKRDDLSSLALPANPQELGYRSDALMWYPVAVDQQHEKQYKADIMQMQFKMIDHFYPGCETVKVLTNQGVKLGYFILNRTIGVVAIEYPSRSHHFELFREQLRTALEVNIYMGGLQMLRLMEGPIGKLIRASDSLSEERDTRQELGVLIKHRYFIKEGKQNEEAMKQSKELVEIVQDRLEKELIKKFDDLACLLCLDGFEKQVATREGVFKMNCCGELFHQKCLGGFVQQCIQNPQMKKNCIKCQHSISEEINRISHQVQTTICRFSHDSGNPQQHQKFSKNFNAAVGQFGKDWEVIKQSLKATAKYHFDHDCECDIPPAKLCIWAKVNEQFGFGLIRPPRVKEEQKQE